MTRKSERGDNRFFQPSGGSAGGSAEPLGFEETGRDPADDPAGMAGAGGRLRL